VRKEDILKLDLTPAEMWKILDAIKAYQKDYAVSGAVSKTFSNIQDKINRQLSLSK